VRPGVSITVENDALGGVAASADGLSGFVLSAEAAKLTEGKAYQLFNMKDAEALGLTAKDTKTAHAHFILSQFYKAAGTGSECWIVTYKPATKTLDQYVKAGESAAETLLNDGKGIRLMAVSREETDKPVYSKTKDSTGMPDDVVKALAEAQSLAEAYATKFRPVRVILDGHHWNGTVADLPDLRKGTNNRCAVCIAGSKESHHADIGLVTGTLAALPVQRKLHRVKNGSLPISEAYFTDKQTVESKEDSWDALFTKGYLFIGTHPNVSGYFFIDDPTAAAVTDDYRSLSRGRVMDKLIVIAQQTFIREVGDEIALAADGSIAPAEAKHLQGRIESAITLGMIANEELSAVEVSIDLKQNVLSTNKVKVKLRGLPVGYKDFIEVSLGFTARITNTT